MLAHRAKKFDVMHQGLQACLKVLPPGTATPPELYLNMAKMYADAQMAPQMAQQLTNYLKRKPNDWKAWLDLAYINLTLKRIDAATEALRQARRVGGAEAERTILSDQRFKSIAGSAGRGGAGATPQNNSLMKIPGLIPEGRK